MGLTKPNSQGVQALVLLKKGNQIAEEKAIDESRQCKSYVAVDEGDYLSVQYAVRAPANRKVLIAVIIEDSVHYIVVHEAIKNQITNQLKVHSGEISKVFMTQGGKWWKGDMVAQDSNKNAGLKFAKEVAFDEDAMGSIKVLVCVESGVGKPKTIQYRGFQRVDKKTRPLVLPKASTPYYPELYVQLEGDEMEVGTAVEKEKDAIIQTLRRKAPPVHSTHCFLIRREMQIVHMPSLPTVQDLPDAIETNLDVDFKGGAGQSAEGPSKQVLEAAAEKAKVARARAKLEVATLAMPVPENEDGWDEWTQDEKAQQGLFNWYSALAAARKVGADMSWI